ncbi:MAG: hypothetical protein LBC70_10725 [Chitinispirillales bacterium]|nr:hypothetical protein [Chitinispirillales bacterium]
MKFIIILLSAFVLLVPANIHAVSSMVQPYRLVDGQTAGVLPRGYFNAGIDVYAARGGYGSGLLFGTHVGLTNRLTLGLTYGGEGLIGYSKNVRWNHYPGMAVKYRLFEEKFLTPALTLGFDNQGHGGPVSAGEFGYDGYLYKSPGLFVAVSKNYLMLKVIQIGFHGTANYSFEEVDGVAWPNVLGGIDIGLNDELMFVVEYDFALDDVTGRGKTAYGLPWYGFLNMGLRWAFTPNFHIQFDVRDILENKTRVHPLTGERTPTGWNRALKIMYISKF